MMNADPQTLHPAQTCLADLRDVLAASNINPRTGLATDYLNHFNEMVMLLQLLPEDEGVAEDIAAWRPMGYLDYFAASGFRARDLAISTYGLTDPAVRTRLDDIVASLDRVLTTAQSAAASGTPHGLDEAAAAAFDAGGLIAEASALIDADASGEDAQAHIDMLFDD